LSVVRLGYQADVEAECIDGIVDMSAMLHGNGKGTVFTWYLGSPYYDSEMGEIVGELLVEGEDYTIDNGVTTFLKNFNDKVTCLLTNDLYPDLTLKTPLLTVTAAGISDSVISADSIVDVYDLMGVAVKTHVTFGNALDGLAPGIYVIGSQKFFVR
ncbi:MAG: hypothetical protein K2K37_08965, partial [Muribaculaceae bacterium]|nr:hypothetical protein [Muribaculaceae bacterium]